MYYCNECKEYFKLYQQSFKYSYKKQTWVICCPYCKETKNIINANNKE